MLKLNFKIFDISLRGDVFYALYIYPYASGIGGTFEGDPDDILPSDEEILNDSIFNEHN